MKKILPFLLFLTVAKAQNLTPNIPYVDPAHERVADDGDAERRRLGIRGRHGISSSMGRLRLANRFALSGTSCSDKYTVFAIEG